MSICFGTRFDILCTFNSWSTVVLVVLPTVAAGAEQTGVTSVTGLVSSANLVAGLAAVRCMAVTEHSIEHLVGVVGTGVVDTEP